MKFHLFLTCVLTRLVMSSQPCFAEQQLFDPQTRLVIADGYEIVTAYCIGCHTAKTIREHRATLDGWKTIIRKMQKTGHWEFDSQTEKMVLDYLSENYPLNLLRVHD